MNSLWNKPIDFIKIFFGFVILIGFATRFLDIETGLFWHDEIFTVYRATGKSGWSVYPQTKQASNNRTITVGELLYNTQHLQESSSSLDTIHYLINEEPQHPPLFFLIARLWIQIFGQSVFIYRMLSILFSLNCCSNDLFVN